MPVHDIKGKLSQSPSCMNFLVATVMYISVVIFKNVFDNIFIGKSSNICSP